MIIYYKYTSINYFIFHLTILMLTIDIFLNLHSSFNLLMSLHSYKTPILNYQYSISFPVYFRSYPYHIDLPHNCPRFVTLSTKDSLSVTGRLFPSTTFKILFIVIDTILPEKLFSDNSYQRILRHRKKKCPGSLISLKKDDLRYRLKEFVVRINTVTVRVNCRH